jgi:hypothetical protein
MILASMILSATLMVCCGALMALWILSDKPLVAVTIQVATPPITVYPPKVELHAGQVFK